MDLGGRVGAFAIIGALLLRFGTGSMPQKIADKLSSPKVAEFVLYTQTGRTAASAPLQPPHEWESAPPLQRKPLTFTASDAELVSLHSTAVKDVDIPTLLKEPLSWDLYTREPAVLILHTHTSESYRYTGGYEEDGPYRTLDEGYNMLSIGTALAQQLEQAGIGVVQDRTVHDYPSYNGAYADAREELEAYLQKYPSICLVLDLHRDAIMDSNGNQLAYTCGQQAQLMLVVGTNHDKWQENMALAVKLQARLEQLQPGICRPMVLRGQRFNQDLLPGMLLIEVGAAGNTLDQALAAVDPLSHAIIDLAEGTTN